MLAQRTSLPTQLTMRSTAVSGMLLRAQPGKPVLDL